MADTSAQKEGMSAEVKKKGGTCGPDETDRHGEDKTVPEKEHAKSGREGKS